jgi:hypothetical protein
MLVDGKRRKRGKGKERKMTGGYRGEKEEEKALREKGR